MVYHAKKVYRTTFRNLANGHSYWLATSTAAAPRLKYTREGYLTAWDRSTGAPTITSESDKSVAVIRVPRQFTKRKNL